MLKYFSIGNIYTLEDMPYIIYDFDLVQNSSKYSLIIDFFDSKDIEIEILRHRITEKYCCSFGATCDKTWSDNDKIN